MDYTVVRSDRRTIAIQIKRDGRVVVRAPYAATEEDVYPPQKAPAAPAVSSRSLFACTWRRLSPEVSPIKR